MPVTSFDHYNLRASRAVIDQLRDFYLNIVGLKLGYRPPFKSFGYWLYVADRDVLHLTEARQDEARAVTPAGTFDHVAFTCTDLTGFEMHLKKNKISYTSQRVPLTSQHQVFFKDPAGNGVELNFVESDA